MSSMCEICGRYQNEIIRVSPPANKYRHTSMPNTKSVCVECANITATHLIRTGKCKTFNELNGKAALKIED